MQEPLCLFLYSQYVIFFYLRNLNLLSSSSVPLCTFGVNRSASNEATPILTENEG
jgi:hypothetical protein